MGCGRNSDSSQRTDPFRRTVIAIVCVAITWAVALVFAMLFRPKSRTVFVTNSPTTSTRRSSVRPSIAPDDPSSPWEWSRRPSASASPSASLSPSVGPTVTTSPTKTLAWTRVGNNDVTGKKPGVQAGNAVALSGDGDRLFVLSNVVSYVGVFDLVSTTTSTTWEERFDFGSLLNNAAPLTLATTPDGRVLVVGSPRSFGARGAAYVFKEDDETGVWDRKGRTMVGIKTDTSFGNSVDVADDGDRIAVGNPERNFVMVFDFTVVDSEVNENVDQREEWIVRATLEGGWDTYFGNNLALSGNGSRIAITSFLYPRDREKRVGFVNIYDLPNNNVVVEGGDPTHKITENRSSMNALATSLDGTVVAIGNIPQNYVSVFRLDAARNEYLQIGDDLTTDQPLSWIGYNVALSRDGSRLAVGAPSHDVEDTNNAGKVYVYFFVGDNNEDDENGSSNWNLVGELKGEQKADYFGWAVSLSDDGDRVAIGAVFADVGGEDSGSVVVYELS